MSPFIIIPKKQIDKNNQGKFFCVFFLFFLFIWLQNSQAFSPEERLPDEAQEQRAMRLFTEVKCLVCNGQSIESSNTEFSYEMRKLIRQKIANKLSDEEILAELTKEFGKDVLFSSYGSYGLWLLIFLFSVALIVFVLSTFNKGS